LIFSFSGLSPTAPEWQRQGKNTSGLAISGHHPTELRRDGCWIPDPLAGMGQPNEHDGAHGGVWFGADAGAATGGDES